jgi:uncharacterized protein YndB with AHSA1/START domain
MLPLRKKEVPMRSKFTAILVVLFATAVMADETGIRLETTVKASLDAVWDAWTTEEGVKFFAPGSRIDLRPDGWYEIYFDPKAPEGKRGADGMRVMLVQPKVALAFTWNAPEKFPNARNQRTHVMIRLYPLSENETRVVLTQDGFGEGEEWDKVRQYFRNAWGGYVLPRLVQRFEKTPAAKSD